MGRPSVEELKAKARELVMDAASQGGELWEHLSPATVEAMIRLVAADLADHADIAARLRRGPHQH